MTTPWNKGLKTGPRSVSTRKKQSISAKKAGVGKWMVGKKCPGVSKLNKEKLGAKNTSWMGDMVGYRGIHHWVSLMLGKAGFCSNNRLHIASRYHWANKSGEYKRDISDWESLCPKCHKNIDMKKEKVVKIFQMTHNGYAERRVFN